MPESPDLERLAASYRRGTFTDAHDAHPSDDLWERLASGAMSADDRAAIGDHVLACAECLAVYRVVMHVATHAATLDPEA